MTVAKKQRGISTHQRREDLAGYAFLSINFIGYVIFKLIPLIIALLLSFSDWTLLSGIENFSFVGLENYAKMLSDDYFWVSVKNTFIYSIGVVPVSIFLALIFAVILNENVFGKGLLRLAFYLPNVSSMVAVSIVWMILYLPDYGLINSFLSSVGIQNTPGWLNSSSTSLLSVMIVGIWQVLGYNIIIVVAGLQGISVSLYESANIDGANPIQKFFYITIPSLSNTMFFLTMISLIRSFQVFASVQIMTEGGPGTSSYVLVYYIYKTAFENNKLGYASAMSWGLFSIVFAVTLVRMYMNKRAQRK